MTLLQIYRSCCQEEKTICTKCNSKMAYIEGPEECKEGLPHSVLAGGTIPYSVRKCLSCDTGKMTWISVNDRLPEKNKSVLVITKKRSIFIAACDDQNAYKLSSVWFLRNDEYVGYTIDNVTHWMPLPEAPKE